MWNIRSFIERLCIFLVAALGLALLTEGSALRAQPTHALTLNECLRESLLANHTLLARSTESDAAGARAKGSTASRLPRLFATGSAQHTSDPYRLQAATENNQPGIFTRDTWQAAAGVALPIYAGGRLAAEQSASRLLAQAAAGDLAFARQALAVRVVALYQDALALRAVIRSLDQSRATLTAQVERIDALLRQQKAAQVDRLRVTVRLARVDQNAIEARNRLEIIQATLAVLMGREPSAAWELADNLSTAAEPAVDSIVSRDVRADEAAVQARAAAAARIEASRLAVAQAQESLRIEQRKYELGQGTITDVLDAQAAADEAESLRARALADHFISLAARDFAAGHVFTSAAALPVLRGDPVARAVNNSPTKP